MLPQYPQLPAPAPSFLGRLKVKAGKMASRHRAPFAPRVPRAPAHSHLEPFDVLEWILGATGLRWADWGPMLIPGAWVVAAPGNHKAEGAG